MMKIIESGNQFKLREGNYTKLERFALRRFHPRRIMFDLVGWMWATYFLWNHSWESAALTLLATSGIGYLLVMRVDPVKMAKSSLGRLAFLHLHPGNMTIQLVGLVFLVIA